MIGKAKEQVREIILSAIGKLVAENAIEAVALPAFAVELPGDASHGDLSCNVALVSAKALQKKPRDVAQLLMQSADLNESFFQRIEVAGPGFINFFLGGAFFRQAVSEILVQGGNYGRTNYGQGTRVLVEFVSANPTGPMHIGNARGGAYGDSLAAVLQFAGYSAEREFYINDAGNQIQKFGLSLDIRYQQEQGIAVEMPEDSYHGEDIIAHARRFSEQHGRAYLDKSEEERRAALVAYALPLNIATLEQDLLKYRIRYDTWFRESTMHDNGEALRVVQQLTENGYTYEQDGAVWFKATQFGLDKDIVLVRSNGVLTYIVPDIAYHYNKLVTRKFDIAIDCLGADHHGYKARMEAALEALGIDKTRLHVQILQMVRLVREGETIKFSKRSGKAITLATLLDEVPVDAARFIFNLRDANTHIDFDLDLAIEESSKNPVYYVQYAHARICSVIRKLEAEGHALQSGIALQYTEPAEFDLIRKIAALPVEINEAAKEYNPARLTRYVIDLAQLFHKFYDQCRLMGTEEAVLQARLALCIAVRHVFQNVLGLLKVEAPEKM